MPATPYPSSALPRMIFCRSGPSDAPSGVSAPSASACCHIASAAASYFRLESPRDPWRATSSVKTGVKPGGGALTAAGSWNGWYGVLVV